MQTPETPTTEAVRASLAEAVWMLERALEGRIFPTDRAHLRVLRAELRTWMNPNQAIDELRARGKDRRA